MNIKTLTVAPNERDCIHCIPPFKLYCFPSISRNAELRNKWIRALKRQNKDKTEWKPSESDRDCFIHFVGSAYEANSALTLNLGYEVEEKKARRTLIRPPLSTKVKLKKMMSMMKIIVPLPIFATELQPAVTCSTSYNWSATPLASPGHFYSMNEENMSLPSYSNWADEIKALKIGSNILKSKIKTFKRPVKVLVRRHDKFTWKKIKTDAKMRFYTGIASVSLFNAFFTLIKPYRPHMGKDQNMPCDF